MSLDKKTRSAKESPPPIEQLLLSGSRLSQANSSLESSQEDSMFKMSDSLLGVFSDLEPALVEPPRNRKSKVEMQLRDMALTNPKANQQKVLDIKLDKAMAQQGRGSNANKEGETGDEMQAGSDEREMAEDGHTKRDGEGDREQSNHSSGDYESFRDLLNPKHDEVEPDQIDTNKRKNVEPVTVVDYPSTGHVEAFTPLAKKPPLPPKSPKGTDTVMPVKLHVHVRKPSQASPASVQSFKSSKSTKSKSSRESKKIAKSDSAAGKTRVKSLTRRKSHDAEAPEPECIKPTVSANTQSSKIERVGVQSLQRLEKTASTSSKASIHSTANPEQKHILLQEENTTSTQPIEKTKSISADSFTSSQMREPSVCLPPHFQRLQQIKHSEKSPQSQSSSAEMNESNKKDVAESTTDATTSKLPPETPLFDLMPSLFTSLTGPEPPALEESTIGNGDNKAHEDAAKSIVKTSASELSKSGSFAKTGINLSNNAISPVSTPENVAKSTENPVTGEESAILLKTESITRVGPVAMERSSSSDGCQSTTSIASAPAEFPSAQRCPSGNDSSTRRGLFEEISQVPSPVPNENSDQAIITMTEVKKIEEPAFLQTEVAQFPKWKTKFQGFFNRSSKPSEGAMVDLRDETAVLGTEGVETDVDEDIQLLEDNLERNDDVDLQVAEGGMKNNVTIVQPTPKAAPQFDSTGRGIFRRPKAFSAAGKGSLVDECSPEKLVNVDENIQLPEDNLERKDGVDMKVVEEDMENPVAADKPTPKAASKVKSTGRSIFRRPKAESAVGKGSFGGECPPEKLNRSPSPDRVSIAASEISLPLTSIAKKDEHFFATATSSLNVKGKASRRDNSEVHPSTESRAIKVDYRNTKEIEIVNGFKQSSVAEIPSPSSHQVASWDNASQGIAMKKWPNGKAPGRAGKGKISRLMAKYVSKRLPSPKRKQTGSMAAANNRANDDSIEMPNYTEVKIFENEMKSIKTEEATTVEGETPAAELVEECFPNDLINADSATEAMQSVDGVDLFDDHQVQREPKVLQVWLSKVNDFILTGCSQIGCGDEVCPKPPSQKVQDEWVSPVHSDIEPFLSGDLKIVELKTPDSNTDTHETDAVDLPDGAETVDNQPVDCRYEDPPATPADKALPAIHVESSNVTAIDSKSSLVDKNDVAGSKKTGVFKIPRSLKKTLHSRWKTKQLTVACPNDMNAGSPTSQQDDAGMPNPTTPASPSVAEIVASLENASYRGPTPEEIPVVEHDKSASSPSLHSQYSRTAASEASPVVEHDKSVSTSSPHSQDSRTAKIPKKKKVRLFRTGVAKWKVAKLLGAQKHRNAAILADADAPAGTSSNMEYRTVLAVSDESLNEEEHPPVGHDPHLTPIVEMADSEGKSRSAGPNEQDPSFESASIDPRNQLITSPTGGTEETGIESTLSILDDHSQDQKKKAVPAEKHRSEQTRESGQSADVSYYRGTFDDDLSNVFMPRPVTGGSSKWFW